MKEKTQIILDDDQMRTERKNNLMNIENTIKNHNKGKYDLITSNIDLTTDEKFWIIDSGAKFNISSDTGISFYHEMSSMLKGIILNHPLNGDFKLKFKLNYQILVNFYLGKDSLINFRNKVICDAIVLESDELTIGKTLSKIKPNYVVVTNVCRDSIRRNAYPEYIKNKLDKAFDGLDDTVFILNADDPLSSFICKKSKNKYFVSVNKLSEEARENSANDFTCCPKCNGKIKYIYRHYRHIGKFKCTECGFESIESNYKVTKVDYDNSLITLDKNDYKLVSPTIFNVYNESLAIVFFKLYGLNDDEIKDLFNNINVPESRENVIEVNGYKIHMQLAKGQNGSACSTVFESLVKDNKPKRLILILDEDYSSHNVSDAEETITWFYDTDYEFLNNDCIKQIIIPSKLKYDYMLRLKMAGIDDKKFNCIDDYKEAYKEIDLNKKSDIYILYEVDDRPLGLEVLDSLVKEIEGDNE